MRSIRDGLVDILDRPWFRRVWILQEVANASAIVVYCGKQSVYGFRARDRQLLMWHEQRSLPQIKVEGQSQAVREIMPTRRWAQGSRWTAEGGRTMFSLLKHFGRSEATDQRDIVYALRGISMDNSNPFLPAVDYELSETSLAITMACFIFHHELTLWARLDSISDLVAQLDWLLVASITEHRNWCPPADVSHLPSRGTVEITPQVSETPSVTGHWKLIDKALSPFTAGHITISPQAVMEIYRKCDSFIPNLRNMRCRGNISYDDILYAALQNPFRGPQIINEFWESSDSRDDAAACGVNVLRLLWGKEAPNNAFYPGPTVVRSICLVALVSQLIRSRRMLTPFDRSWKSQEDESLLGYSITSGNTWLAQKLLVLGADPNLKSSGWTPLMLVAMNPCDGIEEIAITLIDSRIDLHEAVRGETAMTLAKKHKNTEMERWLNRSRYFDSNKEPQKEPSLDS
ncbi:unnamed protein product [Colletotrichum noveboracense]|uniref:Heterokaryon incompatibility domain-containing protein n=1 Tax=Colletotrichum noveboracense TaxID=2664923 RepID=A0A9W4WCX9_9PEZI|nr:unnamed protein product [Colletotrichum noveboracense]